jgi:hypothetical protein
VRRAALKEGERIVGAGRTSDKAEEIPILHPKSSRK